MTPDPQQLAHDRLTALARERRRDAAALPPLHHLTRKRLIEEVRRTQSEPTVLREPSPDEEVREGIAWKTIFSWLGVGMAVGAMALVIWLTGPGGERAARLAQRGGGEIAPLASTLPESESASAPATVRSAPAPSVAVAAPAAPTAVTDAAVPASGAVRAGSLAGDMAAVADPAVPVAEGSAAAVTTATRRATTPAAAPARDTPAAKLRLDAPQRLRRNYRAASGTAPGEILHTFLALRDGDGLQLIDTDGSVYSGQVVRLRPEGAGGAPLWVFEGQGIRREQRRSVLVTGNFGGPQHPEEPVGGFLELPLNLSVLVDGSEPVEIVAQPVEE